MVVVTVVVQEEERRTRGEFEGDGAVGGGGWGFGRSGGRVSHDLGSPVMPSPPSSDFYFFSLAGISLFLLL